MAENEYEIDELWRMLLADDSWEPDFGMRMAVVQSMHISHVGCPLEVK